MILVRGEAYGKTYDYKCKLVSRTKEKAGNGKNIEITPHEY